MPERKVKDRAGPAAAPFKAFFTLAALLALTACLPAAHTVSSASSPTPRPAQSLSAPAVAAEDAATVAPLDDRPVQAASLQPEPLLPPPVLAEPGLAAPAQALASPLPEGPLPEGPLQAAPALAMPVQGEPAPAMAYALEPLAPSGGLWSPSLILPNGLIDQRRLAEPWAGPLGTAQAGGRLLSAYSFKPPADAPDESVYDSLAPLGASSFTVAAQPAEAAFDPAPSAGTAEPALVQVARFSAAGLKKTGAADMTENLLALAYEQTGRRYLSGGLNPAGFDDAGYINWVFARQGLNIPKTSSALAAAGAEVAKADLRPGDVLVYRNPAEAGGWHVGIYSGRGNFLHASPKAGVVTETDAFGPQYAPYFLGARRFYDDPGAAPLTEPRKMAAASAAVKTALAELGPDDRVKKPAPRPAAKTSKASKATGKKAKR